MKLHVDKPLEACPSCGTKEKPKPLPAMALAHKLRAAYLAKKEEATTHGPQVLTGREYAGLLVTTQGRIGALEAWRALPRTTRRKWRGAGPILEKLRAIEVT